MDDLSNVSVTSRQRRQEKRLKKEYKRALRPIGYGYVAAALLGSLSVLALGFAAGLFPVVKPVLGVVGLGVGAALAIADALIVLWSYRSDAANLFEASSHDPNATFETGKVDMGAQVIETQPGRKLARTLNVNSRSRRIAHRVMYTGLGVVVFSSGLLIATTVAGR